MPSRRRHRARREGRVRPRPTRPRSSRGRAIRRPRSRATIGLHPSRLARARRPRGRSTPRFPARRTSARGRAPAAPACRAKGPATLRRRSRAWRARRPPRSRADRIDIRTSRSRPGSQLGAQALEPCGKALEHPATIVGEVQLEDAVGEHHVRVRSCGSAAAEVESPRGAEHGLDRGHDRRDRALRERLKPARLVRLRRLARLEAGEEPAYPLRVRVGTGPGTRRGPRTAAPTRAGWP